MGVGINGMGRVGRLALRAALGWFRRPADDPRASNRLDVVHVNEIKGGAAATAYLLEFDSIHGRWHGAFKLDGETAIGIDGRHIGFSAGAAPGDVPWGDLGCDVVLECTGRFLKPEQFEGYFKRGVRRVIVAAPVKDVAALNIVVGVNDFTEGNDDADLEILRITNADERKQIGRLNEVRQSRDDEKVLLALEELTKDAIDPEVNLMPALINAARAQVTVGEMMGALEKVFGRHVEVPTL